MRLTQARRRDLQAIGQGHPRAHPANDDLDVEDHDPVVREPGHREPSTAGRELQVFRATEAGEGLRHFR